MCIFGFNEHGISKLGSFNFIALQYAFEFKNEQKLFMEHNNIFWFAFLFWDVHAIFRDNKLLKQKHNNRMEYIIFLDVFNYILERTFGLKLPVFDEFVKPFFIWILYAIGFAYPILKIYMADMPSLVISMRFFFWVRLKWFNTLIRYSS